jgi:hypothetical protein
MDIARLQEKLGSIPDLRWPWGNLRHKLEDILVIGLAVLLCSGERRHGPENLNIWPCRCCGQRRIRG